MKAIEIIWGLLRLSMGWLFLWSFLDKVFGLGFATEAGKAWVDGVSPTAGFLARAVKGPFADFYQSLAGNVAVDWLFMAGLLLVGLALLLGVLTRIAGQAGALMVVLMYTALLPPQQNPFLDEHLVFALVMIGLTFVPSGDWLGLGKWWKSLPLVRKYLWLE